MLELYFSQFFNAISLVSSLYRILPLRIKYLRSIDTVLIEYAKGMHTASQEEEEEEEEQKEEESEVLIYPTFEDFWTAYDKKIGSKEKAKTKFEKLSQDIKDKIMNHIFEYVRETPDKSFKANPETYLNQERWNNEIIKNNGKQKGTGFTENLARHFEQTDPNWKNL